MNVLAARSAAASRVGCTSVRGHRSRVVADEHHRRLVDGRAVADVRPRERDRQRGDRRQQRAPAGRIAATSCGRRAASSSVDTAVKRGPRSASSAARPTTRRRQRRSGAGRARPARRVRRSSSQVPPQCEQPVLVGRERARGRPAAGAARARPARALALELGEPPRTRRARCRPRSVRPSRGRPARGARPPGARPRADRGSRPRAPSGACAATRAGAPRRAGRGSRRSRRRAPAGGARRATRRSASASPSGSCVPVGRDALGRASGAARPSRAWSRAAGARRASSAPNATSPTLPGAAHAEPPEHERHALGDVGLQPPRGAERHRRRDVEHDPGRQRALGHVQADVRLAGAGGRRGIDVAHVVADLVRAQLRELGADADAGGAPVAGQHARDQPVDRDVERLDQRLRRSGPGPGAPRAARGSACAHPALTARSAPRAAADRRRARGRRPARCSSSSSAVTPSLSAS